MDGVKTIVKMRSMMMGDVDHEIKVTNIGGKYHCRLFTNGKLNQEVAVSDRSLIGPACTEMLRWEDKMGNKSDYASSARKRQHKLSSDNSSSIATTHVGGVQMKKISSQNAKRLAVLLDKVANLVEQKAGNVDRKLVASFVGACDRLADSMDAISKRAEFDATTIGEEVSGPLESDSDEPWMKGEFTQEEFTGVQSVVASKKRPASRKAR